MKVFNWDPQKNEQLKRARGVGFEDVVYHIGAGDELDVLEHPHPERYPNQKISVVQIDNCGYLVSFVDSDTEIFLKTIYPNRKATNNTPGADLNKLDAEEKGILQAFEAGELKSVGNVKAAMAQHCEYAAATFQKDSRINIRISSKDLRSIQKRALCEGLPYQTLIASLFHKYVEGRLVEQR